MLKISNFFYRYSTGWVTLIVTILFAVFTFFTLPSQNALTDQYSQGAGSPDTSLFYNGKTIYQMAEVYGAEGRAAFVKARWTFDLVFPLIFSAFFTTSISWLFSQGVSKKPYFYRLNVLPVFGMLFDYLENIGSSLVMTSYPAHQRLGEWLAPVSTPLKWLFVLVNSGLLIFGLCLLVKNKLVNKASK